MARGGVPAQEGAAPADAPRGVKRAYLWVAAAVALVAGLVAAGLALHLGGEGAGRLAEQALLSKAGPDGRITLLVFGLDQRTHEPARTDTILVVSLDIPRRRVGVLFIPRDTRVRVAAGRYGKINSVYALAGATGLERTVSQLVGVPLDGYVRLDFQAFSRFVDAIGGVEVVIERPMRYVDRAQQLYIDLPPGRHRLYGEDALDYVRFRADGLGDVSFDPAEGAYRGRLERQQRFLQAVLEEVRQPQTLRRLPRAARELYGLVETNLPVELAVAGAIWLAGAPAVELVTGVLPGTHATAGPISYWLADAAAVASAARRVLGEVPALPSLAVFNANGVRGAAASVARELERQGYPVVRVANAPTSGLERTVVVVGGEAWKEAAIRVARQLGIDADRVLVGPGGSETPTGDGAVPAGVGLAPAGGRAVRPGRGGSPGPGHSVASGDRGPAADVVVWVGRDLASGVLEANAGSDAGEPQGSAGPEGGERPERSGAGQAGRSGR